MAGDEPEVGDKVSWSWNGAQPGGEVAEKKTEGELAIQSKRGNTIKKAAQPNDPAIHMSRPGNDVVKNASELQIDEKKAPGASAEDSDKKKKDEPNGASASATPSKKRKADTAADADGGADAKKSRGRPKGPPSSAKKAAASGAAATNGEKKSRGRPKGSAGGGAKKEKTDKKSMAPPTGIGKRTRSQK